MPAPAKKETPVETTQSDPTVVPDAPVAPDPQAPTDTATDTPAVPEVTPAVVATTGAHIYADDEYVDVWDQVTGEASRVPQAWLGTQLGVGLTTDDPGIEHEPADPNE